MHLPGFRKVQIRQQTHLALFIRPFLHIAKMLRIVYGKNPYRFRMIFAITPLEINILRLLIRIKIISSAKASKIGSIRPAKSQLLFLYLHRQIIRQHQNPIRPYMDPFENNLPLCSFNICHRKL